MNIKEILSELYKDGMSAEELMEALNGVDMPETIEKSKFDKTASELAEMKRKMKEIEKAKMSDAERLEAEIEAAKLAKEQHLALSRGLMVKAKLAEAGFTNNKLADVLVEHARFESDEGLSAVLSNIIGLLNETKVSTERAVKAAVLAGTPTPPPSEPATPKEAFDKMTITEKIQFKQSNPEEYALLMGGNDN